MNRPKLLDLFCCGGAAGMGYWLSGFDVVGVDIAYQPNHPACSMFPKVGFQFVQADALRYLAEHGRDFDAIHASPPCQGFSQVQSLAISRNGTYRQHANLIEPIRDLLEVSGKPYVIENVPGAPLCNPVMLCGSMFGLKVYRHRLFEANWKLIAPPHVSHQDKTPSAGNGISPKGFISVCGTGGVRGLTKPQILKKWASAMGIDWLPRYEMSQAIPPAYTEFIGRQLLCLIDDSPLAIDDVCNDYTNDAALLKDLAAEMETETA